jgi:hypothetical protein
MSQSGTKLREYRPGTFDKRVAYGQRNRKLLLVARGIMGGFKVKCRSEKAARNLAYSLRMRALKVETEGDGRFGLRVRVEEDRVYVVGVPRKQKPNPLSDRKV